MTQELFDSLVEVLGEPNSVIRLSEDNIVGYWEPITNRTLDDCVYGNRRGSFDHVCVNRISANIEYIHVDMQRHGVLVREPYKTHLYKRTDYFKADEYAKLVDLQLWIAEQYGMTEPVPRKVPELTALLYTDVNDLETITQKTDSLINAIGASCFYANEACCGE